MEFIRKRLKGLAALITAAATALTALPMTAAAEDARYRVVIANVQSRQDSGNYPDCYIYTDYKQEMTTAPIDINDFAKESGFLQDFYELGDTWNLWGGGYTSGYNIEVDGITRYNLPTVCNNADVQDRYGFLGTFDTQTQPTISAENAEKAVAKNVGYGDSQAIVLIETTLNPISYEFQVYADFSADKWAGIDPVFNFTTNIKDKTFPTEELASRKLPSTLTIAYHYSYEDGGYDYKERLGTGEEFWKAMSDIAQEEKNHNSSINYDQMVIYYDEPSIILSNSEVFESGIDYTVFTDGVVTLDENKFISEHSKAGDVWRIHYKEYDSTDSNIRMVSGDKLASLIVELKDTEDISMYHYDSIYVVNTLSEGSSVFFTENEKVDPSAVTKYTFGLAPVSISAAAASAGLKPADAEYDAKFYAPSKWTIWGVSSSWIDSNTDGKLSSTPKQNGKLDTPDDFLFEEMTYAYEPVLQVHSMELKKFNIACAEAEGGKLTYTAADHSAFPTKDGVTLWELNYKGNTTLKYNITNSNELWNAVTAIIDDSTRYGYDFEDGAATLTPADPWDQAVRIVEFAENDIMVTSKNPYEKEEKSDIIRK